MTSESGSNLGAQIFGVVLVLAPLLLGALVGNLAQVGRTLLGRIHVFAVVGLALVPLALCLPIAEDLPSVGTWDVISTGLWIGVGILLGGLRASDDSQRMRAPTLGVIAVVMLLVLEGLSRLVLPSLPPFPPARDARLILTFSDRDPPCFAMFPDASGFIEERSRPVDKRAVKVVHVGDSMVAGTGVMMEQSFPNVLSELQPEVGHINAGEPGAGPESHFLVASRWVERSRANLAVIYFFMGNDVMDIDRAYPCCGMGPLLDYSAATPTPRCTELEWTFPLGVLLSGSPPPYPFRVASGYSSFAAHVTDAFGKINQTILQKKLFGAHFGEWKQETMDERFTKVERILGALRDKMNAEKTPLLMVVLPYRETLEQACGLKPSASDVWATFAAGRAGHERVVATAKKLGIDVIDPWDLFKDAICKEGAAKWFADKYPGDVHFSVEGHKLIANWLKVQLEQRGIGAPAHAPEAH